MRYERLAGITVITGHGTTFAVDLLKYGFASKRLLLTAAHNVLDAGKPIAKIVAEVDWRCPDLRNNWIPVRIIALDTDLDLCLLEASEDVPALLELGERDPPLHGKISLLGSPKGEYIQEFAGIVIKRFERGTARYSAKVTFQHGDSGGPIIADGKVAGIAVAGIPKEGDLDPDIGLFVPISGILAFLEEIAAKGIQKAINKE